MTWSYSRIEAYHRCPYHFLLRYIKHVPEVKHFFSDYGTFVHRLIEQFLTGKLSKTDVLQSYICDFHDEIVSKAPTFTIFHKYFDDGLQYFQNITMPAGKLVGVEKSVEFKIDKYPFVGVIDRLSRTSKGLVLADNKSRALKPRSRRKKLLRSDEELDAYLRQLYLYSTAVEQEYHELPVSLVFNCFRTQTEIVEPFSKRAYEEAKRWAVDSIHQIENETEWRPCADYWQCTHICGACDECEYASMI